MKEYAARITSDLEPFLHSTKEDALVLVLETLSVVVKIDTGLWLTPTLIQSLSTAILGAWRENSRSKCATTRSRCLLIDIRFEGPIILSVLTDVISGLASSKAPGAYSTLAHNMLPALVSALKPSKESWLPSSALELIVSVLEGGQKGQLGEGFVAGLAPALFICLDTAEDREVIVVRTLLS